LTSELIFELIIELSSFSIGYGSYNMTKLCKRIIQFLRNSHY